MLIVKYDCRSLCSGTKPKIYLASANITGRRAEIRTRTHQNTRQERHPTAALSGTEYCDCRIVCQNLPTSYFEINISQTSVARQRDEYERRQEVISCWEEELVFNYKFIVDNLCVGGEGEIKATSTVVMDFFRAVKQQLAVEQ